MQVAESTRIDSNNRAEVAKVLQASKRLFLKIKIYKVFDLNLT